MAIVDVAYEKWKKDFEAECPGIFKEGFLSGPETALRRDLMRTAYMAGKKAARQPVGEPVAYLDLGAGGYMDLGTDLSDEELAALPKGRHMLAIIGTYGVDGYKPAQAVDHEVTDAMVDKAWNRFEAALHADDGDTPEDRVLSETIDQRDRYHEMADDLAGHFAAITGVDIGEHSSANCPWQNAIEAAEEYKPAQAVDLAENMLSVLIEEGVLARNGRVFQKLRALIDSKAS